MNKKPVVLVIDDEPLNIFTLSQILGDEFTILAGNGGPEGIKIAREMRPDIVLLDIVMPGMYGFEVLVALQEHHETKNIPVIFITAEQNLQREEQGLYLGATDYITKPFTSHIIKIRIRNQLKIHAQLKLVKDLAIADPVTGIFARDHFVALLDEELQRSARTQLPLGFAIFNVDDFARYNDVYGKQKCDDLLFFLSQVVTSLPMRPGDRVARWGSDEFVLMLPNTSSEGTRKVADDIRIAIYERSRDEDNGFPDGVTVSVGVHSIIPPLSDDFTPTFNADMLIACASVALSYAKKSGKNVSYTYQEAALRANSKE